MNDDAVRREQIYVGYEWSSVILRESEIGKKLELGLWVVWVGH